MTTYEMAKHLKQLLETGSRDRAIKLAGELVEALEPKGAAKKAEAEPEEPPRSTRGAGGRFKKS